MRHFLAPLALALVVAVAPPAAADPPPPCTKACAGAGAFNPALADSPVTVILCTTPQACSFGGPK